MDDELMEAASFHGLAQNVMGYAVADRLVFALRGLDLYESEVERLMRENAAMQDELAQAWGKGYLKAVANGTDHWGVVNPYSRQE